MISILRDEGRIYGGGGGAGVLHLLAFMFVPPPPIRPKFSIKTAFIPLISARSAEISQTLPPPHSRLLETPL